MKKNKLILGLMTFVITLSAFAQEVPVKTVESEIESKLNEVDIIVEEEGQPSLLEEANKDCAEGDPEKKYAPNSNLWNTVKHLATDTGGILIAPAGWTKEEWLKASAIVAGIILISTQDKHIKDFAQANKSPFTEKIAYGLEKIGNGGTALPALGLTYAAGVLIKNEKLQNASLTALEAATVAAILTTLGKHVFHRTRPYKTDDPYEFDVGNFKSSNVSFPSGHTGTAFAIATVFAEAYKDNKIIPYLAYSAATLAGLSRIHDNKHWASDVAFGAVLGYAAGKFVSNRRLNSSGITIVPSVSLASGGGFSVTATIPLGNGKKKKK